MDEKRLAEIERKMGAGFGEYYDSGECDEDMRALIAEVRRLQGFQRGEYICRKCYLRQQEGAKEESTF